LIEDGGWAELLGSFGTQRTAGIKYGVPGIPQELTRFALKDLMEEDN